MVATAKVGGICPDISGAAPTRGQGTTRNERVGAARKA